MPKNHTEAIVSKLPSCDIHGGRHEARYDVNLGRGWGNVCEQVFKDERLTLGLGLGQRLVLASESGEEGVAEAGALAISLIVLLLFLVVSVQLFG